MERKPEKRDLMRAANEAAYQEALAEELEIVVEKKSGSATFRRKIKASSAAAALNGVACLIRELADTIGKTPVQVLALLATVMTVPTIREQQAEEDKEEV